LVYWVNWFSGGTPGYPRNNTDVSDFFGGIFLYLCGKRGGRSSVDKGRLSFIS
jgi:hypothetical protein